LVWRAAAPPTPRAIPIAQTDGRVIVSGDWYYIAVSVAQDCDYCIHSHTAAARAKGMTEAEYGELVEIVGMAAQTNRLVQALGVPVDEAFKA
jgi:AhpD family alkylhydroperoxidase